MKKIQYILSVVICFLILAGCKNSENKNEKSTDLVSIRTLGLAYLEEFKLEEAEKEFLRFIDLAPDDKFGYANLGLTYLRMAKYPEAEKQLQKALKIDPNDADTRLILATVFKMSDQRERSLEELRKALESSPGHIKVLYDLSEMYVSETDPESLKERGKYLDQLVASAPDNIVPHLNLTEIYIRQGEFDKALEQLEIIKKQFPEFPKEAVDYYNKTLASLRKQDNENSILQFTIFHNYMKVTAPYQAGIMDLKGPGGNLIGFPLITFDQQTSGQTVDNGSILDIIKFTEVSVSAGLDIPGKAGAGTSYTEIADYDGDGDADIYVFSGQKAGLFNNDMGRFRDVTGEAGLDHSGSESSASFSDYDNDGFLDLYILKENGDILYKNTGKGTFENVTNDTKLDAVTLGNKVLFFDSDHDGDLDLYRLNKGPNMLFRNNADGTFLEMAEKMGLAGGDNNSTDAAFGDFDGDEDVDLIVTNENSINRLYSNQRQGIYWDLTEKNKENVGERSSAITVGDFNNDGFLDFFTASDGGSQELFRNMKNGSFEPEKGTKEMFSTVQKMKIHDVSFIDFDNDGNLDLLFAGEPAEADGRGLFLYHNNGKNGFEDVSRLLPEESISGRHISIFDYNDDGDLDFVISGINGKISLLRNDGGNNNHFVKIKLVGLKAGSAKNNHFGIGAKVEIRAGDLYQTMVVTDPTVHFGIGSRQIADVVRITWTNGVPQNIFFPGTDQALIEAQTLKGSCPFLYTWNGEEYVFVKDVMWRSALGMPLGIMGGTTAYAFPDASDDYLKIPGNMLKPVNGIYSIQVTSELWETIYTDKIQLVALDHPKDIDVYVAEQFSPPPFPPLKIYRVNEPVIPVSAQDNNGNDVLPLISEKDDKYTSGYTPGKYQGIIEMTDLILDPGNADTRNLFLYLNGWIFPTDASINVAVSQSSDFKVVPPVIQVINKAGKWETVIDNPGFPMGKDKMLIVNLSGKFITSDHRIRIRTNMEIYWDQIFFSNDAADYPVVSKVLNPVSADLHYRGFSSSYRKGGRYGPHWFDYSDVSKEAKWYDLEGNYTRFGNVLPLLLESDNKYIISNAGDETTIEFNARDLPEIKDGWERDFLIRTVGWVKDGDLNTAHGNTVTPLPFHGMRNYTPSLVDSYPNDPDLKKYNEEYNTREVTSKNLLKAQKADD